MGKLENRTSISSAEEVPITPSPNPDKTTRLQKLHEQWLESQENHTIIIYTDGSKLDNGSTGYGWAIYHCGDQHLYRLDEGSCHLGSQAEVYDAELHAVQEAVSTLLTTTAPRGTVFICIDNQAAMATLNFNKHNHEYARRALNSIKDLRTLGWQISITWCPSHCNIRGNKRADTLAKQGAGSSVPYRFALTTKTWLPVQARAQFMERWKTQLPLSMPSFTFPKHLQEVEWANTRALWWVFCNCAPTDPPPNITADPCPCGIDLVTSHHLLRECQLLSTQRTILQRATTGDIHTPQFIMSPENGLPLRKFLHATGLGHSMHLRFTEDKPTTQGTEESGSDSREPDFGAFEN